MTPLMTPSLSAISNGSAPARLLVVDDEPEIAESLRDYLLLKTGSQVEVAYSGESALEKLEHASQSLAGPYDLVVLDMRMPPGMSGRDVLDWIRKHPSLFYTRVIILTATAVAKERVAALSAGADDYITKPYQPPELLARVKTMLRSHQLEKQLQQQSQQLSALNEVSTSMTGLRNAKMVFVHAVRGARQILNTDLAAIFMLQQQTGELMCRQLSSRHTSPPSYGPIAVGDGVIGRAFAQQNSICLNYPESNTQFDPAIDSPAFVHLHNLIAAPLIVRGRPVGVLVGANKQAGDFSDVDRGLFASLTNSVASAVENAWLFTNVHQQHDRVLEGRNRLQAVIDGIPHSIYTVNEKWELVAINQNKADELDTVSESLVGKVCYQTFFQRNSPCEHCKVVKSLQFQEEFRWSVREIGDDHLPREWDVNAYPIPSNKNELVQAVVVWEDITEERRLEYSLMQAGKLAAIGQLAAGVAHEINNPMAVINASAAMLKLEVSEEDDKFELIDLIEQAGERAAKVVRNLLDFARQEEYSFDATDINEVMTQSLALISYQLQSANIKVIRNLSPDLPKVYASGEHLKTVWINLIINARDAVRGYDNAEIEVMTRISPEEEHVLVMVRDNGKGMPQSELEHIFEPFFTTKDPGEGTGLGLSTSHRIIEQHMGEVEVVSEVGEGTTFIIRLPVSIE
jgi:two-component system NtrC family sensor kinase